MPTPDFDASWPAGYPYPSQRMPVYARSCVATSHPLAAQAGLEMLRAGGTAADAAVATAACLTVVEPTSNGLGSDAFALVWAGGGLHGLNASGRSPRNLTRDLIDKKFPNTSAIPFLGWGGVTVPGAVSGWIALHERFGTLPLEQVIEPAVRYATLGHLVAPQTSYYWRRATRTYTAPECAAWRETFAPKGEGPHPGELVKLPDHARTLAEIAQTRGESFYRGPLAAQIARAASDADWPLDEQDLSAHQADWVRPISTDYHGVRLHEIPPNGQGLVALIALGILRAFESAGNEFSSLDPDSPESLHLQIEAQKLAFADGRAHIADAAHARVTPEQLLEPAYLAERSALLDTVRAGEPTTGKPLVGGTVYLTAADADGMMVSYIQSNYTGFGSGQVVPGTGIALQNRGCCFTLERGHPNEVGPAKRPYHTIIPAFVTATGPDGNESPVMSFGVMGGFMQPQGHAQVLTRMVDHQQNPQAALDAPRFRFDEGRKVAIEPGLAPETYDKLRALGHELTIAQHRTVSHGRGQAICRLADGYLAASDARADGQAVGL